MNKSYKKIKIIILMILLFCIFISIIGYNLFNNLKKGKNYSKVVIIIDLKDNINKQIKLNRISVKNKVYEVKSVQDNYEWEVKRKYIKKIQINIFDIDISNINKINITTWKKNYVYNSNDIKKKWIIKKKNINELLIETPDEIFYRKSVIPLFNNIINWNGDLRLIKISLFKLNILLYFFISVILLILLFNNIDLILYIYLKKILGLYKKRYILYKKVYILYRKVYTLYRKVYTLYKKILKHSLSIIIIKVILILLFIFPILLLIVTGNSMSHHFDEGAVVSLLKAGEAHTNIISYPLSLLLVYLYKLFPLIQWYSLVFTLSLITASVIYVVTIFKLSKIDFVLFYFTGLFFFIMITQNISITHITCIFYSISFLPLLWDNKKKGYYFFIVLLSFTFSLRNLYLIFIPMLLMLFFIILFYNKFKFFNNINFNKLYFLLLIIPISILFFYYIGYQNNEYKNFLKFNKARSTITVYGTIIDKSESLNLKIFKLLYNYDNEVLSNEEIIEKSLTIDQIFFKKFKNINYFYHILNVIKQYYIYFIILFILYINMGFNYNKRNIFKIVIYFIYILCILLYFFSFLIIRDVERVSTGMLLFIISSSIVFFNGFLSSNKMIGYIRIILIIILFFLFLNFNMNNLNNENKELVVNQVEHYRYFIKDFKDYNIIPAFYMPYNAVRSLFRFVTFKENYMIGNFTDQNFFAGGWLIRHPFFNKKLSEEGYNRFYDFMMDRNTVFFGNCWQNDEYNKLFLKYLDQNFSKNNEKHKIKTLKIDDYYSISKIVYE